MTRNELFLRMRRWRQRVIPSTNLAMLTLLLSLPAMAQQAPLTGEMMDGRQPAADLPRQTAPVPPATRAVMPTRQENATSTPAQPMQGGAHVQAAAPAQPLMPAYTNLRTTLDHHDAVMASAPPPPPFGSPIGVVTEQLMRMQAGNSHAAPPRSMLGDEASAAYKRYINSFTHPIPEFFQTEVQSGTGSGSGSPQ